MSEKLAVLVTGVTGKQGGAVARRLVKNGHRVRGLTRNVASQSAKAVAAIGVELVAGDLDDRAAVDRAVAGMDALVAICTPYERGGEAETRQGMILADAAEAAGAFLVYSSVANADRRTGVPHFDTKFAVEQHIRSRGIKATIVAPAFFMENLFTQPQLGQGIYNSPLSPTRRLAQVAVEDIAAVIVSALENRERHAGKRYDLASDELTGDQLAATLSKVTGRPVSYQKMPMEALRSFLGDEGVKMFEWFESTGYSCDRATLRRDFPEIRWHSFEDWARAQNLSARAVA